MTPTSCAASKGMASGQKVCHSFDRMASSTAMAFGGCLSFAEQKAQERAFSDRTRCEIWLCSPRTTGWPPRCECARRRSRQPGRCRRQGRRSLVVNERTSSEVIGRPTETCGIARAVDSISDRLCRSPSRISSAMTSLMVRFCSCSSCGLARGGRREDRWLCAPADHRSGASSELRARRVRWLRGT